MADRAGPDPSSLEHLGNFLGLDGPATEEKYFNFHETLNTFGQQLELTRPTSEEENILS